MNPDTTPLWLLAIFAVASWLLFGVYVFVQSRRKPKYRRTGK